MYERTVSAECSYQRLASPSLEPYYRGKPRIDTVGRIERRHDAGIYETHQQFRQITQNVDESNTNGITFFALLPGQVDDDDGDAAAQSSVIC